MKKIGKAGTLRKRTSFGLHKPSSRIQSPRSSLSPIKSLTGVRTCQLRQATLSFTGRLHQHLKSVWLGSSQLSNHIKHFSFPSNIWLGIYNYLHYQSNYNQTSSIIIEILKITSKSVSIYYKLLWNFPNKHKCTTIKKKQQ